MKVEMSTPHAGLPVCPDLSALRGEVDTLMSRCSEGDAEAAAFLAALVPEASATTVSRADAELAIARRYQASSWKRLEEACALATAIWRDDATAVRELITRHPALLHEPVLIRTDSNWGPPLSYAANLGRDGIIEDLLTIGARDLEHALDRAVLQSQIATARRLHEVLGRPVPPSSSLGSPAYTLSVSGTKLLFELGVRAVDEQGASLCPVSVVLETDSRKPAAKHAILEMYAEHGLVLPDTPTMALHRGRLDLLEEHLAADPALLHRTFRHEEIYPPAIGCHDEVLATHGTPLDGTTLLHMAIDYDERDVVRWLLDRGANPDTPAALDADGFGGHTPLFSAVVSQPAFWMNHGSVPFDTTVVEWLLKHGASINARASLRKQLHPGYGESLRHVYLDVTPLSWGRRFHRQEFVNHAVLRLLESLGAVE